jgi:signal peptidase I
MKEYNEAEFIPRFKVGNRVKIRATGQQGEIIKIESIENLQTGKISPTEWYHVHIENGSYSQTVQRHREDELTLA